MLSAMDIDGFWTAACNESIFLGNNLDVSNKGGQALLQK